MNEEKPLHCTHGYKTDCPYCEIDRLKESLFQAQNAAIDLERQLAEARAEVVELKETMPPTFKESVKIVVAHINDYYGLEG